MRREGAEGKGQGTLCGGSCPLGLVRVACWGRFVRAPAVGTLFYTVTQVRGIISPEMELSQRSV